MCSFSFVSDSMTCEFCFLLFLLLLRKVQFREVGLVLSLFLENTHSLLCVNCSVLFCCVFFTIFCLFVLCPSVVSGLLFREMFLFVCSVAVSSIGHLALVLVHRFVYAPVSSIMTTMCVRVCLAQLKHLIQNSLSFTVLHFRSRFA